jgi:hypothetical protein
MRHGLVAAVDHTIQIAHEAVEALDQPAHGAWTGYDSIDGKAVPRIQVGHCGIVQHGRYTGEVEVGASTPRSNAFASTSYRLAVLPENARTAGEAPPGQ